MQRHYEVVKTIAGNLNIFDKEDKAKGVFSCS